MIRADLRTYILTHTEITDLIADRLFLSRVPQADPAFSNYPCIVYRRTTSGREHDLDGAAGYAAPIFEFHVIGQAPLEVEEIGEELRLALDGYRGLMGSTSVGRVTLDEEADDYIQSAVGDDIGFHRTVFKYTIGYTESIPSFS